MKYEELEHEIVFAAEWDKYARQQYQAFHGKHSNFYNDVTDMNGTKYKDTIDLLCWGSPCQDLSLAGKRKGFDGDKSSLFREGARIQSEIMPKTFIFENVKGLLSSNKGADYKEVIRTFRDMGYHIAHKVLNAKKCGTAQNRERLFIVGFLDVNSYHSFNFEDSISLTKVLRDYLEDNVNEKYFLSQKMIDGFISHGARHKDKGTGFAWQPKNENDIANCLRANGAICPTYNTIAISEKQEDLIQVGNIDQKGHNSLWGRVYDPQGIGACLNANGGGAGAKTGLYQVKSATKKGYELATENDSINFTHPGSETRRGRVGKSVAQTLDCACNQGVIENYRIRRLTPKECFRLMGVKDEDIELVVSDTQGYKCAGNGIEVNTIRSILRAIYKPKPNSGSLF